MSKQSEYWAKRFAQLEESQHASSEAKAAEIEKQFKEAERTIQNQISEWYVRFADENGEISITKAKKLLNSKELEELRWDVNEYIKHGEENALNQKWMHELENASAKVHINRLEALKLRIQAEGEKLYSSVEDEVKKHIKKQYKDSYYHTAYEIAKGSGVGVNFAAVNEKKLEALINKPWAADGKNFAVRLGESKAQLIDNVYKSLVQMTLTGENPDKAISMLSKTMDGDKKRAARIIMTESAYFTELANKESYKELGVEQYEIIATLDSHTSEICQEMDGKVFDLKDMEPGVTAPPFHPNCRSCTAPYYDDSEFENDEDFKSFVGERAARDEEGKYYTVPANTTYKEWYKGFVGEKAESEKSGFKESSNRTKRSSKSEYGVNWSSVKSNEFTHKFDSISNNPKANKLACEHARKMLSNRDGKYTEEIYAISLTTGRDIASITDQHNKFGVSRTERFTRLVSNARANGEQILYIHNHPRGLPPSIEDLNEIFEEPDSLGITVGHNGNVYLYSAPDKLIENFDVSVANRKMSDYNYDIDNDELFIEVLSEVTHFKFRKL